MRLIGYFVWSVIAVIAAQIGAVIATALLAFANISTIAAAVLGEDTTSWVIGWIGNLAFAGLMGSFIYEALKWFRPAWRHNGKLLGGVLAAILAFVFPVLSAGALIVLADAAPKLLRPLADPRTAFVVVFGAYALVIGAAALVLAWSVEATSATVTVIETLSTPTGSVSRVSRKPPARSATPEPPPKSGSPEAMTASWRRFASAEPDLDGLGRPRSNFGMRVLARDPGTMILGFIGQSHFEAAGSAALYAKIAFEQGFAPVDQTWFEDIGELHVFYGAVRKG